jgi:hypothetical protein
MDMLKIEVATCMRAGYRFTAKCSKFGETFVAQTMDLKRYLWIELRTSADCYQSELVAQLARSVNERTTPPTSSRPLHLLVARFIQLPDIHNTDQSPSARTFDHKRSSNPAAMRC